MRAPRRLMLPLIVQPSRGADAGVASFLAAMMRCPCRQSQGMTKRPAHTPRPAALAASSAAL